MEKDSVIKVAKAKVEERPYLIDVKGGFACSHGVDKLSPPEVKEAIRHRIEMEIERSVNEACLKCTHNIKKVYEDDDPIRAGIAFTHKLRCFFEGGMCPEKLPSVSMADRFGPISAISTTDLFGSAATTGMIKPAYVSEKAIDVLVENVSIEYPSLSSIHMGGSAVAMPVDNPVAVLTVKIYKKEDVAKVSEMLRSPQKVKMFFEEPTLTAGTVTIKPTKIESDLTETKDDLKEVLLSEVESDMEIW